MEGYVLVVLGLGLLFSARAFLEVSSETNSRIFNPRFGKALSWAGLVFGVGVGVAAIALGISLIV